MKNSVPLSLHIPEPEARPGDVPDFSDVRIPEPSASAKPDIGAPAHALANLAYGLIRVLDDKDKAAGQWNPKLDPETLRRGLKQMLLTRAYDDRMYRAQRQGKTSFYMKCTGEEAIAVAAAWRSTATTCAFPSYRQQGLLIARDYPLVDMMNQIYSNAARPAEGPAAADHVFVEGVRLLLDLRQSRHAVPAGRRLGDGVGLQGRRPHRRQLDRRRHHRRRRFPPRADLRQRLSRAGDPQRRQQPVGDFELLRASPAASRRPSPRAPSATACRACASTATISSPSMRPPNGRPSARAPISAPR